MLGGYTMHNEDFTAEYTEASARSKRPKRNSNTALDVLRMIIQLIFSNKYTAIGAIVIIALMLITAGLSVNSVATSRIIRLGLKDIGELTTQAGYFTNVQKISDSREFYGYTIPFTTSQYIFSYDGIVKAGIDFSKIDVSANQLTKVITVKLPKAEIYSLEIDHDSIEIFDESRNIFSPLKLDDLNNSILELEKEVEEQALNNGLLENAQENSKVLVENFLSKAYDLNEYSIVFE